VPENFENEQFFKHLLDDYFEEAGQHLQQVRRNLLLFEEALEGNRSIELRTLNELFRNFHTLKGISGMAGVPEAENLAHHQEGFLRLLREGSLKLTRTGLTALLETTRKLEQVVIARRNGEEIPSIEDAVEKLKSITAGHDGEAGADVSDPSTGATGAMDGGERLFHAAFEPSEELAARNINVNAVRDILQEVAEILESRPVIQAGGKIAFQFVISTNKTFDVLQDLLPDGVTVEEKKVEGQGIPVNPDEVVQERGPNEFLRTSNVVRVDLSRLDELMLLVGELVITRAKLAEQIRNVEQHVPVGEARQLHETGQRLEKQLRGLRDGVMRVRMVPIGEIFERMKFLAGDMARDSEKKVVVEITGGQTEIDKLVVERMFDPLMHLVRNSISHGVEHPEVRAGRGKPKAGVLRLHAASIGESILIEVADDGQGIDQVKVADKAVELGLLPERSELGPSELTRILCSPGFSTRESADMASGRGVGMDVVQGAIQELGGKLTVETERSRGTKFSIRLPLTLSIADAFIVSVDGERYAVPQGSVDEIIEVAAGAVKRLENNEVVEYRGKALPLVKLAGVFNRAEMDRAVFHTLVVDTGSEQVGLAVDRVIGQKEIVVRAIRDPLARVEEFSGATELGDGRPVLIVNVSEVANRKRRNR
jgi:two-component system chemotaxis sensor kinase CheA